MGGRDRGGKEGERDEGDGEEGKMEQRRKARVVGDLQCETRILCRQGDELGCLSCMHMHMYAVWSESRKVIHDQWLTDSITFPVILSAKDSKPNTLKYHRSLQLLPTVLGSSLYCAEALTSSRLQPPHCVCVSPVLGTSLYCAEALTSSHLQPPHCVWLVLRWVALCTVQRPS